ncbi:MAG: hypothetical protein HC842_05010 [Cytophagales bacterium]|nr:hypothetical protein [Cytophagales bacterium]
MFAFFRVNDPYRLAFIFLATLAVHIPYFFAPELLTQPQLKWMLVGDKLASGTLAYRDLWIDLAPLSALAYAVIDWLFGQSRAALELLGLLLITYQAYVFNSTFLITKGFKEYNYVPAFLYALLCQLLFDTCALSPELMGLTFVLLSLRFTFTNIENENRRDETFLLSGFYLALACLFVYAYAVFFFLVVLNYAFLTTVIPRRYGLLFYGLLMAFFLCGAYLHFFGALRPWLITSWALLTQVGSQWHLGLAELFLLLLWPLLFTIMGLLVLLRSTGFNNLQTKFQQGMVLFTLISSLVFLALGNKSSSSLLVFVAPIAFFIAHFFLEIRRKWLAELLFTLFCAVLVVVPLAISQGWWGVARVFDKESLLVPRELPAWQSAVSGQSVWVTGGELVYYKDTRLATRYFHPQLSQLHLGNLDYYDNLVSIFENIMTDPPAYILDTQKQFPTLVERLPLLEQRYQLTRLSGSDSVLIYQVTPGH